MKQWCLRLKNYKNYRNDKFDKLDSLNSARNTGRLAWWPCTPFKFVEVSKFFYGLSLMKCLIKHTWFSVGRKFHPTKITGRQISFQWSLSSWWNFLLKPKYLFSWRISKLSTNKSHGPWWNFIISWCYYRNLSYFVLRRHQF